MMAQLGSLVFAENHEVSSENKLDGTEAKFGVLRQLGGFHHAAQQVTERINES
jgi:hypothetical protein